MHGIHQAVTPGLSDCTDEDMAIELFLKTTPIWEKDYFKKNIWQDSKKTFTLDPADKLGFSKLASDLAANTVSPFLDLSVV